MKSNIDHVPGELKHASEVRSGLQGLTNLFRLRSTVRGAGDDLPFGIQQLDVCVGGQACQTELELTGRGQSDAEEVLSVPTADRTFRSRSDWSR